MGPDGVRFVGRSRNWTARDAVAHVRMVQGVPRLGDAGEEVEEPCNQRQELRIQRSLRHRVEEAHLYSFRFRLPKDIEDRTHSLRWVTAQWKQDSVDEAYRVTLGPDWGPSPFLAQRFDDGVLHVTVQDEHCRCLVAAAPSKGNPAWEDGAPARCASTEPGPNDGKVCTPSLRVEYGPRPDLPTVRGMWVEMTYHVQAGRSGDARIEVFADGQFIVRVTGRIGYEPGRDPNKPARTYFKVGHYRDYQPHEHVMDIDRVRVVPVSTRSDR